MAEDQELRCNDCGQSFTFTAEDQVFSRNADIRRLSAANHVVNPRNKKQSGGGHQRSESRSASVTSAGCEQQTTALFELRRDLPVYC